MQNGHSGQLKLLHIALALEKGVFQGTFHTEQIINNLKNLVCKMMNTISRKIIQYQRSFYLYPQSFVSISVQKKHKTYFYLRIPTPVSK